MGRKVVMSLYITMNVEYKGNDQQQNDMIWLRTNGDIQTFEPLREVF